MQSLFLSLIFQRREIVRVYNLKSKESQFSKAIKKFVLEMKGK